MNFKLLASALVLMGTAASAQSVDDLRIYINPGHGSWTGNDRPMQVIGKGEYESRGTDTTSFFESNTDLIKGFGVLEKLIQMGFPFDRTWNQEGERWEIGAAKDLDQNLVMSRVKNGPYEEENTTKSPNYEQYNRNLLVIATEVEENEFDQFISIHSNAASTNNVNYHLFMYRGKNGRENQAVIGSYEMAEITSNFSFANEHASWSEDYTYINGDVDFMGKGKGSYNSLGYYGYLGVLKHGCPGYLVEGFFHTYTPATHRAMNWDVDMIEGYQYARGVAAYFELGTPAEMESTGEIYGIVRDAHTSFSHELYISQPNSDDILKPINECKVYLWKDGEKIKEYVTDNFYNGAFVFFDLEPGTYQVTFEHPDYLEADPVDVTVEAGVTSYPKCYLTDAFYYGRPGEELNYPDIVPTGMNLAENYDLLNAYTDVEIPQLAGAAPERIIWNKGLCYILGRHEDESAVVVVLDAYSGTVLSVLDDSSLEGGMQRLADIQVTGAGVLVGVSKSKNQHSDKYVQSGDERGTINFYLWDNNADGVPVAPAKPWFATQHSGEWYRSYAGDTFVFRGNLDEGEIALSTVDTNRSAVLRISVFPVTDGVMGEPSVYRPSGPSATDFEGGVFNYTLSPNNRHMLLLHGESTNHGVREYEFAHKTSVPAISETVKTLGYNTVSAGFFKFGDGIAMTMADAAGVKLYNISRGIGAATEIALNGGTLTAGEERTLTTGYPMVTTDAEGNVTSADFAILALRGNRLSRFTTSEADGVADITVDAAEGPARFYDLNGRLVDANRLTPGIYVRLQGTEATKVIIK